MFFGLVLTVALVVALIRFGAFLTSDRRRAERALREAPRATVADLAEGTTARLVGVVTSDGSLRGPLTGRACVAYVARVEEKVSTGKTSRWVDRISEVRGVTFTIDDGTGRALIDPTRSTLLLEMDSTTRSGTFDDATPVEESFLHRHGFAASGWMLNRTLRYTEGVIEAGERVAVLGRGVREPDPDATGKVTGYRAALPTRICIGGSAEHPVLVTDRKDLVGA